MAGYASLAAVEAMQRASMLPRPTAMSKQYQARHGMIEMDPFGAGQLGLAPGSYRRAPVQMSEQERLAASEMSRMGSEKRVAAQREQETVAAQEFQRDRDELQFLRQKELQGARLSAAEQQQKTRLEAKSRERDLQIRARGGLVGGAPVMEAPGLPATPAEARAPYFTVGPPAESLPAPQAPTVAARGAPGTPVAPSVAPGAAPPVSPAPAGDPSSIAWTRWEPELALAIKTGQMTPSQAWAEHRKRADEKTKLEESSKSREAAVAGMMKVDPGLSKEDAEIMVAAGVKLGSYMTTVDRRAAAATTAREKEQKKADAVATEGRINDSVAMYQSLRNDPARARAFILELENGLNTETDPDKKKELKRALQAVQGVTGRRSYSPNEGTLSTKNPWGEEE